MVADTQETDVISESSTENEQSHPSDQGYDRAGSDEIDVKNLRAENQRKAEKIRTMESKLASYEERLSELESIKEQRDLSSSEKSEVKELNEDVREASRKLRSQQESKPWVNLATEESMSAVLNNELDRANDFIEDMAYETKIDVKELIKELRPFAAKYTDKRPERRNILAFRDWKVSRERINSIEEREKKLKAKEDEDLRFRETGGRAIRDTSLDEKFNKTEDPRKRTGLVVDILDNPASLIK